jgi:hypothetical protein
MENLSFRLEPYFNQAIQCPSYLMLLLKKMFKIAVEGGVLCCGIFFAVPTTVVGVFLHCDDAFFQSLKKGVADQLFDVGQLFVPIVFVIKFQR